MSVCVDSEINQMSSVQPDPVRWLDTHGDVLYAFALQRVRDPGIAEDLVQDTLLAAFRGMANFKGDSTERTWLTGILKHKVVDHLRKSGREQPLDTDVDGGVQYNADLFDTTGHWLVKPGSWDEPEQALEQSDFWHTMNGCLDKLPDRLQTLYTLREIDGLETKELQEILNISTANNLWTMLSRARMQLRDCLEKNWFNM